MLLKFAYFATIISSLPTEYHCLHDVEALAELVNDFAKFFGFQFLTIANMDNRLADILHFHMHLRRKLTVALDQHLLEAHLTEGDKKTQERHHKARFGFSVSEDHLPTLDQQIAREREDYWLLHIKTMSYAKNVILPSLSLRLDSNVYFCIRTNLGYSVYEAYKVYKEGPVLTKKWAEWGMDTGLKLMSNLSQVERRSDLYGFRFKIAALPSRPYLSLVYNNDTMKYQMYGMFADVFHVLQNILNFTYEFEQPQDGTFGNLDASGENWTGMIGQLIRGEIDMSPTSFTITEMRSKVIDFAAPIVDMHHRFFIKNPDLSYNWTAYLDPLNKQVWIILTVLVLLITVVLWISIFSEGDVNETDFLLYRSLFFVAGAFTFAKPWSATPARTVPKWLFALIIFSGSLIFWHWEAMLISFLAVKTLALPFTSIENLMSDTDYKLVYFSFHLII